MPLPYPPPWMDKATSAEHIWVKQGWPNEAASPGQQPLEDVIYENTRRSSRKNSPHRCLRAYLNSPKFAKLAVDTQRNYRWLLNLAGRPDTCPED
jgi:hypothetical protein